ncbi:protocatechuate 3,4-dioxygenase subunit alpha [Spirosoma aerolatum]|uniref:protocatechuate 3,4-dioxygenase subunit alpha n=1 Tax=Spirosoma aerolatum TaxID=1211326 RepID=UPI0009AEB538|nr:protocatechuate 3,4-dioxygenase subunit alpha [Spirosoma aerolatum]
MTTLPITPSQTVGPFFAYGLTAHQYGYDFNSLAEGELVDPIAHSAELIYVSGQILDGHGQPISDAMIECWQADTQGQYSSEPIAYPPHQASFTGFGRLGTGTTRTNQFTFTTVKPGSTATDSAPHINIILFLRGSLRTLYTRLYFSDEPEANNQDALLCSVDAERRHTLIARKSREGHYQFDIHLQGSDETVFFDL